MSGEYQAVCDETIPACEKLVKKGKLEAALEKLLDLEKIVRTDGDLASLSRILIAIVRMCFQAKNYRLLNDHIVLLANKRDQIRRAVTEMVHECFSKIDHLEDGESKLRLIETIRTYASAALLTKMQERKVEILEELKKSKASGKMKVTKDSVKKSSKPTIRPLESILRPIMSRGSSGFGFKTEDQIDIVAGTVINGLTCVNFLSPFPNRVCSIRWIPQRPNSLLIGGKGGELAFFPDVDKVSLSQSETDENVDLVSEGIGPGGEIREIIVDKTNLDMFYSLDVSGQLVKVDLQSHNIEVLEARGNFDVWYAGLNVHYDSRIIFMGDNKGKIHLLPDTTRGGKGRRDEITAHHPGKINHIEFHPRNPYIMTTAATSDRCVKIWDIRKMKDWECLAVLPHEKPVNSAYFNCNGGKLVTTDQYDEIRLYSTTNWRHMITINHPHRQFQHITPMRAEWHPLADIIVIGRYPDNKFCRGDGKTIDFYDGRDGSEMKRLAVPNDKLASLNRFNYTGDIMATSQSTDVLIWKQRQSQESRLGSKKSQGKGRSRRKRDDSDDDDDDDRDDDVIDAIKKGKIKRPKIVRRPCKKKSAD